MPLKSGAIALTLLIVFAAASIGGGQPPLAERSVVATLFNRPPIVELVGCLDGIECELLLYRVDDPHSSRFGLTLVLVRLGSTRGTFRVGDARRKGSLATVFEALSGPRDAILVNGGFFQHDHRGVPRPLGLMVSDGRRVSPLNGWTNGGVLFSTPSADRIVQVRDFDDTRSYDHALQSRPMLIQSGRMAIRSDDRKYFERTAIALAEDGSPIAAGAFSDDGQAVSLFEFAELLLQASARHSLHLTTALNMDGGPSAHIYIPRAKRHFGAPSSTYLPEFVAILTRQP